MRTATHLIQLLSLTVGLTVASTALADVTTFAASQEAAGTVAVTPPEFEARTWQQLIELDGIAPYGTSYTAIYDFGAGVQVDALRARLYQYTGDVCGASLYSVDVALTPTQRVLTRYYPDREGVVDLPGAHVYKVGFVLMQSRMRGGRCVLRLDGLVGDVDPTDPVDPNDPNDPGVPTGFELAGVVPYVGGFRHQEVVSLATPDLVEALLVRIPSFCSDLELLEAGTITEGQYDQARLVDARRQIFAINGGAGSRISAIALSLNGPSTLTCDVPVYIKKVR